MRTEDDDADTDDDDCEKPDLSLLSLPNADSVHFGVKPRTSPFGQINPFIADRTSRIFRRSPTAVPHV
ncbi:hypothetical protein SMACR_00339 [Sordaria macrospora]|uniref:WGS project CABT00000000 data, contig 2.1 n=2 Tax=Sordaria macrospora TaxID=5147 RepID=F7VKU5_SORMK|nr:uncharacterized protein SMAC_00339 [Sordaria macrospora k-hell]KAA8636911.1 hypothetical protein SMACR_00339 [Sordaria macrospora]KAH7627714.1 hypothetical protein B0T09DRAFT_359961 [Sordaria sp. MPI-SDFR-AT-0083]WPJ59083.1 hypothetical protein SMAC4_00339 [Sordaria macrospora]CCC06122.1 unnamed protein product [Sordaria macrospora k-hell]